MRRAVFDGVEFERELLASVTSVAPAEMQPATIHVLAAGGKRVRPQLVHRFGSMCGAEPGAVLSLSLAIELLHTATLVHDDLIDEAEHRRGQVALHRALGPDVALLVGDLYLARCGVHLSAVGDPRATAELFGALATIVAGELRQRHHRFDLAQTQADYVATIGRKTASLLEAGCAAAAMLGASADPAIPEAAREYGHHVGIAFQVVDDLLDYRGAAEEIGKPVGNDIREGTVTLPLILALEDDPDLGRLAGQGGTDSDVATLVTGVAATRAYARCEALAVDHTDRAVAALRAFPAGEDREELAALARSLVERRS